MYKNIMNWLFPAHCTGCGKSGTDLCAVCFEKIPKAEPHLDENIHPIFSYRHPPLRRLIWELKFKGRYGIADIFGEVLADAALSLLEDEALYGESKEVVVIPIPSSVSGKKKRGYNQATLLAKAMIAKTTIPMTLLEDVLIKTKDTTRQSEIKHRGDRLKNLVGAFAIPHHSLKGKVVLLIDDVVTTGATIKEARRALRTAGASRIYAITLAH